MICDCEILYLQPEAAPPETANAPDREELLFRLREEPLEDLMRQADAARRRAKGDVVHLRGIVEFSSHCVRNCLYCGLRRSNPMAERYRLSPHETLAAALKAAAAGVDTVVLQSGDDLDYKAEDIAWVVAEIKARAKTAVTLSCGERPEADYALWRRAGADRYLMKHETADPALYARQHPGKTLAERLNALRRLKELGYETGTGFIVGLPGQTPRTLVEDVLLTREIGAAMCGVGPLIPHVGGPPVTTPEGALQTVLRLIALIRILCPEINLPATTALATLDPEHGQRLALLAGANVIMPVFTPGRLRRSYGIYDGKVRVGTDDARAAAASAGRTIIFEGASPHA